MGIPKTWLKYWLKRSVKWLKVTPLKHKGNIPINNSNQLHANPSISLRLVNRVQ